MKILIFSEIAFGASFTSRAPSGAKAAKAI